MVCPKCGFTQVDAAECARCGVIVARHRPRAAAAPVTSPEISPAPAPASFARRLAPVLVAAVLFAGAYRITFTTGSNAAPAGSVPPTASAAPVTLPMAATADALPAVEPQPAVPATEASPEPAATAAPETLPTATCPISLPGGGSARTRVSPSWYTDASFTQAKDEQAATAAPMVIYVYTDWCPYCREFERELLTTRAVDAYLGENAVKVRVNPETRPGAQALADELGVRGYPSFFVMTPEGLPEKMGLRVNGRLRTPTDFIAEIDGRMKRQAGALVAEAFRLQQQGQEPAAFAALGTAIRLRPDDDAPYGVLHQALGRAQRWDEVVACWTSFLDRNPSHAAAHLARADALTRRPYPPNR